MKGEGEEGEERERSREGGEEPYSSRVPSSPWAPGHMAVLGGWSWHLNWLRLCRSMHGRGLALLLP